MSNFLKKQIGATLLELGIIIIVIGIIASVVSISWPGESVALNAQSERLVSDIRYTQFLAMTLNTRYRLNFASTSYSFSDLSGTAIIHPAYGSSSVSLLSNTTLSAPGYTNGYVVFDRDGVPYMDNSIPGTAQTIDQGIILNNPDVGAVVVVITPYTGAVYIQ